MRLAGQVAVVTGAAAGIGAGVVERFLEEGAAVVMVDRDTEGLTQRQQALAGSRDRLALSVGDVAELATAEAAVAMAQERFGRLDALVNNAGIMTHGDFLAFGVDAWDTLMDVNLHGMMLMCRAALPVMLAQGSGSIVNTSSVMATLTEPGYEAYTTSKAGIIGLTKALAVSYAEQGIRVNAICPGWVDTPLNQRLAEELGGIDQLTAIIRRQQPNARMLTTREVANTVLFLSSPEASGVTGSCLYVDGGASAAI